MLLYSEESSAIPGVGVEKLVETGKLDFLKSGPLFWVDSADSQPCMGERHFHYNYAILSLSLYYIFVFTFEKALHQRPCGHFVLKDDSSTLVCHIKESTPSS